MSFPDPPFMWGFTEAWRWLPLWVAGGGLALLVGLQVGLRRRWKPLWVLVAVVAFFGAMEVACGYALQASATGGEYLPDARRIWRAAPNHPRWETNSQGYRNGKEVGAKDQPRILCLGDSWTFGFGVPREETWVSLLEERTGYEMVNAACPGYCLSQVYLTLASNDLDVDAVVLGTTRNQLLLPVFERRVEDYVPVLEVLHRSRLYQWMRREYLRYVSGQAILARTSGLDQEWARLHHQALERLVQLCAARNLPLLLVDVRDETWKSDMYEQVARQHALPSVRVDLFHPGYLLPNDPSHCNHWGHALVADRVEPELRALVESLPAR